MAAISLYLFGLPRIVYQGKAIEVERRKALALMSYLADLPQSRDVLATLLWPNLDQEHARGALRSTLYAMSSLFTIRNVSHSSTRNWRRRQRRQPRLFTRPSKPISLHLYRKQLPTYRQLAFYLLSLLW